MKNVIEILKERSLLDDVTSLDVYKLVESPVSVYAGFDPTSESLQVGNFVAIMALAHFLRAGHNVIALIGGATGMIGDPSGKTSERALLDRDVIIRNEQGVRENLERTLSSCGGIGSHHIVNNRDWLDRMTFIDFLRDVGKHFRMGTMLGKESVKARLNSESGMSFTEFSYQLLQGYDFMHLCDVENCIIQIGGSDQWGNIVAGIDLIRKVKNREVYGVTMPLVCDSSGQKFGKSEGNAVYLDKSKTSYYDFYQFFVRTEDADVVRFLKMFTFLSMEEISKIEKQVVDEPEKRLAQKKLAEEVTLMVHGQEGLTVAQRASSVMFGDSMEGLCAEDLIAVFADVSSVELPNDSVEGTAVVDLAVLCGICRSKGEARRLVENRGLYLNNLRVESIDARVESSDIIDKRLVVLRSGKKNYQLVRIV